MQHRRIDDGEGNDDDLLHLAQIQGRLSLSLNPRRTHVRDSTHGDRHESPSNYNRNYDRRKDRYNSNTYDRETNQRDYNVPRGNGNANSQVRDTSRDNHMDNFYNRYSRHQPQGITGANRNYASAVSRPRDNRRDNPRDNPRANPQPRDSNRNNRTARNKTSVITGTNNNCAVDVVNYIRSEASLNLRCDPLPTRYDSYRSCYIHAHPRHHDLLLRPGMWPRNVILRQYQSDD